MSTFILDPRIKASSHLVADLSLSQLRLQNDKRFGWLVLIPKLVGLTELTQLSGDERLILWEEIDMAAAKAKTLAQYLGYECEKLNIANLGNIVAQLHIHIIARHSHDAAWPGPVWGFGEAMPYGVDEVEGIITHIKG